jgi:Peptidase family S41
MFDHVVAFLLRLYPEEFRRVYGRDSLQLMWDRAGHERGVRLRARLLMDLTRDLVVTSLTWSPPAPVLARTDGAPRFDILRPHRPRPEALAAGTLTSLLMLVSFALLFQPRVFPPAPAQVGEGSGVGPAGFESSNSEQQVAGGGPESDARHALIELVATNLRERYVDRSIGGPLADALLAFEKNGEYRSIATGPELAVRLTGDIYKTSRAIGIPPGAFVADVVYSARALPVGPPPPMTEEMREHTRARMIEQNCLFRAIETLPRNIGYLKLDGFADASVCQETTKRAMAAVNKASALIVDLRDNGGGYGETALQIAGYLFDRPSYLYDPRPNSPVPSHTASPIPGNDLADKPVFLLTSSRTQSAAEYFVYNLKMLKRVTIVGERTAGHQHSSAFRRIDDHFGMGIQDTAPPDNPYAVKGWEVIGIEPDVTVPGAEALNVATTLAESRARRSR